MNFKATFTLLLTLVLTGCVSNKVQPDLGRPNVSQTPSLPDDYTTTKPNINTDKVAENSPKRVRPNNLVDRIRAGFAFPDLNSKDVKKHERWAAQHPTYLNNLFSRAEPFLYFIVDEIERRGLPMELVLLPAIESAYDPGAVSKSRAAGLWQFIPSTGRGFGLRQDWWYDGRHDPYSSTFAALEYLEMLHKKFDGDWFIALAAYNAGQGTLRREIKRAKSKGEKTNYLSLNLRSETRNYVPKLMALKNIVQNPSMFNMILPNVPNEPYFEVLTLPGQIDLVKFAKDSKIEQQLLRHLNRGFKRWATPPEGPHRLLVPLSFNEDKTRRTIDYARVSVKNSPKVDYRNHIIKKGDTLSGIARHYGVAVTALKSANRLKGHTIRTGKTLMIPLPVSHGNNHTNNSILSNNSLKKDNAAIKHRVEKGDTLWSIARQYRVDLNALMSWNGLRSGDILNLNQLLTVFIN